MNDATGNHESRHVARRLRGLCLLGTILMMPAAGRTAEAGDQAALVARGEYLVQKVAMCSDCHTPRDARGEPLAGHDLGGAPLGMAPLHPVPGWAATAPKIAGLPVGYTGDSLVTLLRSGRTASGLPLRPPMPAYRMNDEDARAIAAYLESLR